MKKRILEILKQKDYKLIAIDKATAARIEEASIALNTTQEDVLRSALELLNQSLGKEVVLVDKKHNTEARITALENTQTEETTNEQE
jgi:hypothetical protein